MGKPKIIEVEEGMFNEALHELKKDMVKLVKKIIDDFSSSIITDGNSKKVNGLFKNDKRNG